MSLADANRKYFDTITDSYDSKPWAQKMNTQVTEAIRARLGWVGIDTSSSESGAQKIRLLDYACGTGLISRALGPYVSQIKGIDIAPKMVKTYNSRASAAGLASDRISATVGDFFASEIDEKLQDPEYLNFDIAAVCFGYHHFDDVLLCTKRLKERLIDGGTLMIIDFLQDKESDAVMHGHSHSHGHSQSHQHPQRHHGHHEHHAHQEGVSSGKIAATSARAIKGTRADQRMHDSIKVFSFDEPGVRQFFEEAGLVDVDISVMEEKVYMEFSGIPMNRTVFFARGKKPKSKEAASQAEI